MWAALEHLAEVMATTKLKCFGKEGGIDLDTWPPPS
jgi:hypothetical protein